MKWSIFLVVIVIIPKEALGEEKVKTSSRSSRSLLSNKNIYKLDHFIELVEKIEHHPLVVSGNKTLKQIANYVRSFGYNNPKWDKLLGKSEALPVGILTTDEKRALRGMLEHGFSGNQEHGVVNTPHGDVAMGRVIIGICAGMNRNKDLSLQEIYGLSSRHIDNLYAATIAGDIAQTGLMNKIGRPPPPLFGPGGTWSNTECPEVFTLLNRTHSASATDAKILGGMDGFLMGLKLPEWWSVAKVRLGQLLRMYYRDGVAYDKNYAACRRFNTFQEKAGKSELFVQSMLSMYAVKKIWHGGVDFSGLQETAIPKLAQTTTDYFFSYLDGLKRNRTACPKSSEGDCSLPANLVFVMDESGSIGSWNYKIEKDFVKNITDAFEILPYETRVAVIEYSTLARVSIKLNEYASKSRLKCAVDRLTYSSGGTYTAEGIKAAYHILQKAQSEATEERQSDLQFIVLLTDGESSDSESLKSMVKSVKDNIKSLTIVSVGIGNYKMSELKLIATDPIKHVFTATDFGKLVNLVKSLRRKTCEASKTLEPTTMAEQQANGEKGKREAKVSGYVSPGRARYFTLPSETLFKTENISIQIKPKYGTVTLYLSRTNESPGPDNYDFKLEVGAADASISRKKRSLNEAQGTRRLLQLFNLCKGYNETNCPPLYFAVVGKNSSQSCSDLDCSVPTQIKFELKTEQIIPKKENICYFELQASKMYEAKDVSIKISAVNDTISYYISRVPETSNLYNNSYKIKHVVVGQMRTITIHTPCKEYNKATCPPVYFFFRGAQLMCQCTGRNCTLPSQVDIKVNFEVEDEDDDEVKVEPPKDNVCYHHVSAEHLFDHRMVEIKVSPVNDTITLYASRVNTHPDKSNHSQKIDAIAVGETTSLNISRPCKGFDRSTCPPLYLTFIGNQLSCNCTGEAGKQRCSLPEEVSVIFTKEVSPSSSLTLQNSACLIIITFVFSLLFK